MGRSKRKMLWGRKKKKQSALTEKESKWNRLWALYADGALESDYYALCDYHAGVNGGGHHCFLDNNEERLAQYAVSLRSLLPPEFFAAFEKAYRAYTDTDEPEEACDAADAYFYSNEQTIIDILQAYADTRL